jgi:hypothetical protein
MITEEKERTLSALDRCDRCAAQAYVMVGGVSGELLFCGHHYNNIVNNAVGYDKIMKFMKHIIDNRNQLVQESIT